MKTIAKRSVQIVLLICSFFEVAKAQPTWQTVTIPNLPSGTSLGAIWARTRSEVYVWASRNPTGTKETSLYRWDGNWNKVLDAPGLDPGRVYGVGSLEVFASAGNQIWRSADNGNTWTP